MMVKPHHKEQEKARIGPANPDAEVFEMKASTDIIGDALKDRLGHCYELSSRYIVNKGLERPGEPWFLMHGTIQRDPHPPNEHAWVCAVMREGIIVYDPVLDEWFPWWVYQDAFHAYCRYAYTPVEAASLSLIFEHHGPWEG